MSLLELGSVSIVTVMYVDDILSVGRGDTVGVTSSSAETSTALFRSITWGSWGGLSLFS